MVDYIWGSLQIAMVCEMSLEGPHKCDEIWKLDSIPRRGIEKKNKLIFNSTKRDFRVKRGERKKPKLS